MPFRTSATAVAVAVFVVAASAQQRVGLVAEVTRSGDTVSFVVRIDPSTLSLERRDNRWQGNVDLLIAQVNRQGVGEVEVSVPVTVSLTDEERSRALTEGIPAERTVTQKDGTGEFRIVARDVTTRTVGSLVIPAARVK